METLKQMFYREGYQAASQALAKNYEYSLKQVTTKFEKENENNLKNAEAKFKKEIEKDFKQVAVNIYESGQSINYISKMLSKPVSVIEQWIFNDKNES